MAGIPIDDMDITDADDEKSTNRNISLIDDVGAMGDYGSTATEFQYCNMKSNLVDFKTAILFSILHIAQ